MKHEEIYHTCDRCGKKIDIVPSETTTFQKLFKQKVDAEEYEEVKADVRAYVLDNLQIDVDAIEIRIAWNYDTKRKKFDLCGECRKTFERFMRNEKG